jgi:hypothetical protein
MREWIWAAAIALPLVVIGGLVHAHSGDDPNSWAAGEYPGCPLRCLVNHIYQYFHSR